MLWFSYHMSMNLTYEEHTVKSKNIVKRWLHRQRFAASFRLLQLEPGQRFLDYGCGDGELSLQISHVFPGIEIVAFDPATDLYQQAKRKLANQNNILVSKDFSNVVGTFDRIACLETVEHLPPPELLRVFKNIHSVLEPEGFCLFTFPIEHGLAALPKNSYRIAAKRDKYATIDRAMRSALGLAISREPQERLSDCNYIYSHVGFDCRKMINQIAEYFSITDIKVLPLGTITLGLGNSVAVIVKRKIENQ